MSISKNFTNKPAFTDFCKLLSILFHGASSPKRMLPSTHIANIKFWFDEEDYSTKEVIGKVVVN